MGGVLGGIEALTLQRGELEEVLQDLFLACDENLIFQGNRQLGPVLQFFQGALKPRIGLFVRWVKFPELLENVGSLLRIADNFVVEAGQLVQLSLLVFQVENLVGHAPHHNFQVGPVSCAHVDAF